MDNFSVCHDNADNENQGISNSNLRYLTFCGMFINNLYEKIILKNIQNILNQGVLILFLIYSLFLFHSV